MFKVTNLLISSGDAESVHGERRPNLSLSYCVGFHGKTALDEPIIRRRPSSENFEILEYGLNKAAGCDHSIVTCEYMQGLILYSFAMLTKISSRESSSAPMIQHILGH